MKNSIKTFRTNRRLTQEALAARAGVSRQTINSIEKKRYTPSTKLALQLSKIFDVSVNELFSLEEE